MSLIIKKTKLQALHKHLIFYVAIMISLYPFSIMAQTKLQKVLSAINRNLPAPGQQHPADNKTQTPGNGSTDVGSFSTQAPDGLKAGDIAPDAVYIDADVLYPFNRGAALIKKGNSYALIDKKGNFIVPFNQYDFEESIIARLSNNQTGIFLLRHGGAVNYKGQLITKSFPTLGWVFNGRFIIANDQNRNLILMDAEGNVFTLKDKDYIMTTSEISEDVVIAKTKAINGKYGYKNLKDEWIVQPVYDYAAPFSEGLACVGKTNEYGELKFGFINKNAQVVILFIYSNIIGDFKGGLARITPKDFTDFRIAYIDKKGNIVQTFKQFVSFAYMGDGLQIEMPANSVMDSTGKVMSASDFLKNHGVVAGFSTSSVYLTSANNIKYPGNPDNVLFVRNFTKSGTNPNYGYVNLKTGKIMEGTFATFDLSFPDSVSKLNYAQYYTSPNRYDHSPVREGYINEDGVFVIVKKEGSKL